MDYQRRSLPLIHFAISLCLLSSKTTAYSKLSWCDPKLCGEGVQHLACNNDGKFRENCQPDSVMINLKPFRSFILHEHNKRRNFIASGLLPGYYPAARMATMIWDEELEYLAALNLKMCVTDHDACHNTYRFRSSGQNLTGVPRARNPTANVTDLIHESLGLWYGEYPLINSNYIRKFRVDRNFEEYGHFAEAVLDRNTHVGCAMMRFTRPDFPHLYIYNTVCNYASTYALDTPVYRVGDPASECTTGPNPNYPSLCSLKEEYNPNYELHH